ncbi:MAG TPA: hypothetical protein VL992_12930, partial [Tepidisphaeraceae bacterium]|nr:hypothetical protein [Tepidisphaeraceae bacterium]
MRRTHTIVLLLAAVTLAVFGRAIGAQFVTFDDEPLIYANPHFHPPDVAGLIWHWTHPHWNLYIPVVYTAWWLIAQARGANDPTFFHTANLLLHFGSGWLCFLILRALVKSDWAAAGGAMLFLVHPLQAEPVAWATGMKDVLSGFLSLATIWAYVQFVERRQKANYALATFLFLLALLAKPSAVTVPLICLIVEVLIQNGSWRRSVCWLTPWLIPAAAIAIVSSMVQPAARVDAGPIWARPLVAGDALAFYLGKLVWPVRLAIYYGRTPRWVIHFRWWTSIVPVAMAVLIARIGNRRWIAAAAIFVAALLPVLGFWPFLFQIHSTVADRYMYLAMLGPALALATLLSRCGRIALPGMAVVLALLGILSFVQTGYWRDSQTLYQHAIVVNPASFDAHNNLGVVFASRGDVPAATDQYQICIDLNPRYVPAYRYVADADAAKGDWPAAAGLAGRAIDVAD